MQVVFMTGNMEALDGASERIARNAERSMTFFFFICFNL
jgi:hypothetical protein